MAAYRALLVGLGQIGCGYDSHLPFHWNQPHSSRCILTHARALACHPDFELVAGVDTSSAARQRFVTLYGKPAHEDLKSWYSASLGIDPDLVVIAVAPQLQPVVVAQLLSIASPRLLLLEKPVAASLQEANALEQLCIRQPNLLVAVNYIRRYLPSVQMWQRRIQSGELGGLLHGRITYGKGLLSNGSHFVNLAEAWLGPLKILHMLDSGSRCFGFDRESSLELVLQDNDTVPLLVRCVGNSGLRAGELDLWFEGGRLCWQNDGNSIDFWSRQPPVSGDTHAFLTAEAETFPTSIDYYQHEVLKNLQAVLAGATELPACTLDGAIQTLRTLEPAVKS